MKFFIVGLILGLIAAPIAIWAYLRSSNVPVAVADRPLPFEAAIVRSPLHRRIDREMPKTVPIEATPDNLQTGAHIYRQQCASCHGLYGMPSDFASGMYPSPTQLWQVHGRHGVVGVSDDPPQETYWKIANGIRLSGMPSFRGILNDTQMWQVALLLANANHPLPDVLPLLQQPLNQNSSNQAPPAQ